MSSRADRDLLGDIQEALRRARSYTKGQSYEQFLADTKTQDAVIRSLEILGEATKKLSPALRGNHPLRCMVWRRILTACGEAGGICSTAWVDRAAA